MAWTWRFEDPQGAPMSVPDFDDQEFTAQGDAESWLGEVWRDLLEDGVAAVTLLDGDREVYGPMSLYST